MTPKQMVAEEAARLVRQGWAQGTLATNKAGKPVSLSARNATNFCAYGALLKAGRTLNIPCSPAAYEFIARTRASNITEYNDRVAKSAEDVAQIFDRIANNES